MSKGVHDSRRCTGHRFVYVYISVKGSRVCKPSNVLDVHKYVRASTYKARVADIHEFTFSLMRFDVISTSNREH